MSARPGARALKEVGGPSHQARSPEPGARREHPPFPRNRFSHFPFAGSSRLDDNETRAKIEINFGKFHFPFRMQHAKLGASNNLQHFWTI